MNENRLQALRQTRFTTAALVFARRPGDLLDDLPFGGHGYREADELAGRFFNEFLPEFVERAFLETTGKLEE